MQSGTSIVQSDETKLKATVFQGDATKLLSTVSQNDYTKLLATVKIAETTPTPADNFNGGQKTVAVPGTCELLHADTACIAVVVKALSTNVGIVYVGGSGLSLDEFELNAKEAIALGVSNLNKIYVDAASAGEGVCYAYLV